MWKGLADMQKSWWVENKCLASLLSSSSLSTFVPSFRRREECRHTQQKSPTSKRGIASVNGIRECCFQQQEQTAGHKWTSTGRLAAHREDRKVNHLLCYLWTLHWRSCWFHLRLGCGSKLTWMQYHGKFNSSVKERARLPSSTGSSLSATPTASESYGKNGLGAEKIFFGVIHENFFAYFHIVACWRHTGNYKRVENTTGNTQVYLWCTASKGWPLGYKLEMLRLILKA